MWSRDEIKRREEHLRAWLTPAASNSDDDGDAGRLVDRPYQDIARALLEVFPDKKISVRSVQRFVQDLRDSEPALELRTRTRGRPRRPPLATRLDDAAGAARTALANPRNVEVAIWRELLVLTGLSRTQLHKTLAMSQAWARKPVSRSAFMDRLAAQGTDVPPPDGELGLGNDWPRGEHTLRLHQVVLEGRHGETRVILLAYDTKSHYINARLIVLLEKGQPKRQGPPVLGLFAVPSSTVTTNKGRISVRLPAKWLYDFADQTQHRLRLIVSCLLLHSSLGPGDELIKAFKTYSPSGIYTALPDRSQQLHPNTFEEFSAEELGKALADRLNAHNQAVAASIIQLARARLDHLRQARDQPSQAVPDIVLDTVRHADGRAARPFDADASEFIEQYVQIVQEHDKEALGKPSLGTQLTCTPQRWLYELISSRSK